MKLYSKNHSLFIASYPTGRDAAVSYPEMDFVWSNPLTSDVLLKLKHTDTSLTATLYSTPTGYKVSTETGEWEEGEKFRTEYETDDTLAEGAYYQKTTGSDGSQITVTRTVTDLKGDIIKQDTFTSVYAPKNEVYAVGPGTDMSTLGTSAQQATYDESVDTQYDVEAEYTDADSDTLYDDDSTAY